MEIAVLWSRPIIEEICVIESDSVLAAHAGVRECLIERKVALTASSLFLVPDASPEDI